MRRSRAAVGSAAFFVAAPGTVVGVIPWLIARWRLRRYPGSRAGRPLGVAMIGVGLVPVVSAFVEFAKAGGTPLPLAPTEHLVVTGFNRYVRNPMYVGLLVILLGQSLLFGQPRLLLYTLAVWMAPAAFVRWYEEPTLLRQYGPEYEAYRRAVPAWVPRVHPWSPSLPGRA
jgi:protein-S-isoprenylcysteine O-methyltransferase Ste14